MLYQLSYLAGRAVWRFSGPVPHGLPGAPLDEAPATESSAVRPAPGRQGPAARFLLSYC